MTTFSYDIKSNIILYSFTSSSFCSSMTRSGSISSAPVLCGCAQTDSCVGRLWYWPAHWQPRRAYGQQTCLKYTSTSAEAYHSRAIGRLKRGNANIGTGSGRGTRTVGIPSLVAFSLFTQKHTRMTVCRYRTHLTLSTPSCRQLSQSQLTNVIKTVDGRRAPTA